MQACKLPMVDIHSHVLPGLDDGPRRMDESLRMCELYVAQGVATVVATPHMCNALFDEVTAEMVRQGAERLAEACRKRGLELAVIPGGEVRLQPELMEMLDAGEVLTLGDSGRYMLLELPNQVVPRIERLVFELALRGITPVLSHPEHNLEFRRSPGRLAELVEYGCLVQVSADCLLGAFGRVARRAAARFVSSDLVHVVASDAHSASGRRRPQFDHAARLLGGMVGEDRACRLLCTNPGRIVRGESLGPLAASEDVGHLTAKRAQC
ncbi:MAG: phosphotransferase [Candidatus Brocadiae bacterium]|nr:phosphotransferase [Candidatus Brocadiia bacterium]